MFSQSVRAAQLRCPAFNSMLPSRTGRTPLHLPLWVTHGLVGRWVPEGWILKISLNSCYSESGSWWAGRLPVRHSIVTYVYVRGQQTRACRPHRLQPLSV